MGARYLAPSRRKFGGGGEGRQLLFLFSILFLWSLLSLPLLVRAENLTGEEPREEETLGEAGEEALFGAEELPLPSPTIPPVFEPTPEPPLPPAEPAKPLWQRETLRKVVEVTEKAVTRAAPAAGAIAVGSAAVSVGAAAAANPGGATQLFFPFLALRRRRIPLGRVVENKTGAPLANAVVTILDERGKPRTTLRTNADGTFGVLLPRGTYNLHVLRKGYKLAEHPRAPLFPGERYWQGKPFRVREDEALVPLVVAMNPLDAKQRPAVSLRQRWRMFFDRLSAWQSRWALPIIFIGAALNTWALWRQPSLLAYIFEVAYVLMFLWELWISHKMRKLAGQVRDALKRKPLDLALVRLVDAKTRAIVMTKVTTRGGHFFLMPPRGEYELQVVRAGYLPHRRPTADIGKGWRRFIRALIELQPLSHPAPTAYAR
jgi:hypothetical protein